MKTGNPKQTTIVADHEAGHAVASWHFGHAFKYVTIKPDESTNSLGHVLSRQPKWLRPDVDLSDRTYIRLQREIVILCAGQIAEAKFRGKRPRFGYGSDNQAAVDLAFHRGGSGAVVTSHLRYCFELSKELINARWREVEKVATALEERQTLSYNDVIEVIMSGAAAMRERMKAFAKKKN